MLLKGLACCCICWNREELCSTPGVKSHQSLEPQSNPNPNPLRSRTQFSQVSTNTTTNKAFQQHFLPLDLTKQSTMPDARHENAPEKLCGGCYVG